MITPIPPSPAYSADNEGEFRRSVQEADTQNLKSGVGFYSFIMLDETDGSAQKVTMVGGVLTVTAL
jgi:VCBS repeat-containing protein